MKRRRRNGFAVGVFALLSAFPAEAEEFELYGYRQGMSVTEAKAVASQRHYAITRFMEEVLPDYPTYEVRRPGGEEMLLIAFCGGKLDWASYRVPGGFRVFVWLVEDYKATYPLRNMDTRRFTGTDGSQHHSLSARLNRDADSFYVEITLFGNEWADAGNAQVSFVAFNREC